MLFVSPVFLFIFLPCVLAIYYLLKKSRLVQNLILFLSSIFFYAWGEPVFSLILLASILVNWLLAMILGNYSGKRGRRVILVMAVCFNIGLLFVFKYLNFSIAQINHIFGLSISFRNIALPIGVSFFTFQALSYVIDVFSGGKGTRKIRFM